MIKRILSVLTVVTLGLVPWQFAQAGQPITDANPMKLPAVGDYGLRIITSNLLELTLITTGTTPGNASSITNWNFVANNSFSAPSTSDIQVSVGGSGDSITSIGFKRRPLYAPLSNYDLRIGNYMYLQLSTPIPNNAVVTVNNASQDLWGPNVSFVATNSPMRITPVIHVNQEGYMPAYGKWAEIGYYLGSMGELQLPASLGFNLVNTNGTVVYSGTLTVRKDNGFTGSTLPYQDVLEADFSSFTTPGEYQVQVPTLGVSYPFVIDPGIAANFARTYELGLYHSRCGYSNCLPYTRFVKGQCHEPAAAVPNMSSTWNEVNSVLANMSSSYGPGAQLSSTPLLSSVSASLYPFVNTSPVDTHGGHHDAGDYSKYTVDVAQLCHMLLFSVDSLPGVAQLDNLGVPESGDGIPDVLQEALWEIDFLSRLQDSDGGFYFLVYPQQRQYEANVSLTGTDLGDPQCVFPKTVSATAAAVGALAEAGSSPWMKKYYPANATNYMAKAALGYQFLQNAWAKYGRLGSYQAIQQYGDSYTNADLIAWADAAMYAATGNTAYQTDLMNNFNPADQNTFLWTWWSMYEGWGCAIRDYAFAARSGRLQPSQLNASYLAACENQIIECADTNVAWNNDSAYRNSLADEYKSPFNAGWVFSVNQNFDIAVADAITNKPGYIPAMIGNMNYEAGCNPVNMPFLTGIGAKRQHQIVSQYADNQYRSLPPTGIPIGSVQGGFVYLAPYDSECSALTFPADSTSGGYAPYDRWADTFNTMTEEISWQQGRCLAAEAYLMAVTGYTNQQWSYAIGTISGLPQVATNGVPMTLTLSVSNLNMANATYVWEATGMDPTPGATLTLTPNTAGGNWIEVEALLPDGRRVFATNEFTVQNVCVPNSYEHTEKPTDSTMAALYHLDNSWADSSANNNPALAPTGDAYLDPLNVCWMTDPVGSSLHTMNLGDQATAYIPSSLIWSPSTWKISVEAMIYVNSYLVTNLPTIGLYENWNAYLQYYNTVYPNAEYFSAANNNLAGGGGSSISNALTPGMWHHVSMSIATNGYAFEVDGTNVFTQASSDLANWSSTGGQTLLTLGNFDGWIDEVIVRNYTTNPIVVSTNGGSGGSGGNTNTVGTPSISPNGGTYTNTASVTITSSSGVNIYYTTNGTTPTTNSSAYSGPVLLSSSTTVQALAASGTNVSPVTTAQFTVVQMSGGSTNTNSGTGSGSGTNTTSTNTTSNLPAPWQQMDIGAVGLTGSASYANGVFTVNGSGADVWGTNDAFHYIYVPLTGNGQIVAQVTGIQPTDPWAKAGVMFRQELDAGSPHAFLLLSSANGVAIQDRSSENGSSSEPNIVAGIPAPYWLMMSRSGNVFSASISPDGNTWSSIGSMSVTMNTNIYVGLAVTAHNASDLCASTFANVQVTGGTGVAVSGTSLNPNHSITVTFTGGANTTYYVQASTNLGPGAVWQTIATNTAGSNGTFQYNETNASSYPRRFFRAALP